MSNIKFHEKIEKKIEKYCENNDIINTLFYGPPGSGKDYQVQFMLKKLFPNSSHNYIDIENDNNIKYKVSQNCIYIDGHDWKNSKASLNSFIEEVTETGHISGSIKLLYIRYIDVLDTRVLKQLLEDTYKQCRFIFTCRSLDKIDPAMISRCVTIRVPSPTVIILKEWLSEHKVQINSEDTLNIIEKSFRNANTIKHNILLKENVFNELALKLLEDLENSVENEQILLVQGIAEKYFKCNISYNSLLKEFIKIFKEKYKLIENFDSELYNLICICEKFMTQKRSIYDILSLFLNIVKMINKLNKLKK